jgi:hypothetical protein
MFKDAFNQALKRLVENSTKEKNVEIISHSEETRYGGGSCRTCYFEYTEVEILYLSGPNQEKKTFSFYGDFVELINTLMTV